MAWRGGGRGVAVGDRCTPTGVTAALPHSARPAVQPPPWPVEAEPSAEERVLLSVEYGDLGQALQRLSPELRAVVQATILDGLTSKEAARLLGIPQNTVKTRLHRAKAHLRTELTGGLT